MIETRWCPECGVEHLFTDARDHDAEQRPAALEVPAVTLLHAIDLARAQGRAEVLAVCRKYLRATEADYIEGLVTTVERSELSDGSPDIPPSGRGTSGLSTAVVRAHNLPRQGSSGQT